MNIIWNLGIGNFITVFPIILIAVLLEIITYSLIHVISGDLSVKELFIKFKHHEFSDYDKAIYKDRDTILREALEQYYNEYGGLSKEEKKKKYLERHKKD